MNEQNPESEIIMSSQERSDANKFIIDHLHKTMRDSRANFAGLRTKLTITYWVMIVLSIVMFIIGIVVAQRTDCCRVPQRHQRSPVAYFSWLWCSGFGGAISV